MLYGRDISHHDGASPGLSGLAFVICKATEGSNYVDPTHDAHVALGKAKSLVTGSYHFLHPSDPGQAAVFLAATRKSAGAVHLYAVDVEMLLDGTHPTYADLVAFHELFHKEMPGRKLVVYSYRSFWEGPLGNPVHDCPDCVLWTSYLHLDWPPAYGGFLAVTLHQYSTKSEDLDRYDFGWADLVQLGSIPLAPPKPKPVPKGATPLLVEGMSGQKVADVQHALDLLHNSTAHVDGMGHFRAETLRVLRLFQLHRGLKVTGTVTPETWRELRKVAHPKG